MFIIAAYLQIHVSNEETLQDPLYKILSSKQEKQTNHELALSLSKHELRYFTFIFPILTLSVNTAELVFLVDSAQT